MKEQFNNLVNGRLEAVKHLLTVKGAEYIRNNDPFHNFNVGSKITGESPQKVLDGMLLKHYISYRDMLKDIEEGKQIPSSYIQEKFGDIITYFVIQEAMMLIQPNKV
jgi:RecA/RadA recombinase